MSKAPIKVCLISPFPPPYGGIAHWTCMIVRYFENRRDLTVVGLDTAPRWRPVHKTGIGVRAVGGALQLLRDTTRLIAKLVSDRFDVAHLTTSGQLSVVRDVVFVNLVRLFGVPLVYHIRFGRIPQIALSQTMEWRLIRYVMNRSSIVIAIDRETFSAVRQYAPTVKIELIPNCIDLSRLPDQNESSVRCAMMSAIFIGWVIPSKGVTELVAAWSTIEREDWHLQIVGPRDERYISKLREQYPLRNVQFVGEFPHAETMKRLAACDLFVLPSHTEGFPNVVVEAMSLGKPIIATDVGAIPEMLSDNAGIIVAPKDRESLACALQRAIGDGDLRTRIGANARERACRNYALDVVAETYVKVWRSVSQTVQ